MLTHQLRVRLPIGARHGARALVLVAIAVVALCVQSLFTPSPARGEDLSGVFTGVNIVQDTSGLFERMQVDVDFAVPAGAQAGDTATLALADPFAWVQDSFDVTDPDTGEIVAQVVVSGTTATFTFTDYVEAHSPISGNATFFVVFRAGQVDVGDTVEATFTSSETFTDTVVVAAGPTGTPVTRKELSWTDPTTQESLIFAIFGTTLDAVPDATRTVTITDIPAPGVLVDCASVLTPPNHIAMAPDNGGVPGAFTAIPAAQYTLACHPASTPRGFILTLTEIPANYHVRVRGSASVTDPTLTTYTNRADLSIYGQSPTRVVDSARRFSGSGNAQGPGITSSTTTTSTTSSTSTTSTTSTSTSSTSTTPSTTTSTTPSTTSSTSTLAFTGADRNPLTSALWAGGLILGGLVLLALTRVSARRERGRYSAR